MGKAKARYVVFHADKGKQKDNLSVLRHTDEEVDDAAAELINLLLMRNYTFDFPLMENLWWLVLP